MTTEQMRRDFEAWFFDPSKADNSKRYQLTVEDMRRAVGDISWKAWQAAIASQALQKIAEFGEEQAAQPVAVPGWRMVPIEPTAQMISAMSCSKARDDEGEFPAMLDLLDFGGENKTHTVLKAAYRAMLEASPTPPLPQGAEAEKKGQP